MTLDEFNQLDKATAATALSKCCGARKWVSTMIAQHPFESKNAIFDWAIQCWNETCGQQDWLEAFDHHPKIGDLKNLEKKFPTQTFMT